jgi:hypothetical protein
LRSFASGSIAHGTVNGPVLDADTGVVIDRRIYPELGPDGDGLRPRAIVEQVRRFIHDAASDAYPAVTTNVTKRAIVVRFNDPIEDQDPTADLIVALDRDRQPGLWIPNTESDSWDPSHPERHTELARSANSATRSTWARVVRLGKANNRGYSDPALCSFNIEALALPVVETGDLATNLLAFFRFAAADLSRRNTPDPAGVSAAIKPLVSREVAVRRYAKSAEALARALSHDGDEELVREALAEVFPNELSIPAQSPYLDRLAAELGTGSRGLRSGLAIGVLPNSPGQPIKSTRSYGGSGREP